MDRRSFLRSSLYFTVVAAGAGLSACGSGDGQDQLPKDSFAFPLGVASGDPRESSCVFWTRCVSPKGLDAIPLRLEVSANSAFDTIAASAALTASAQFDHTVRAKVTGLAPATRYFYRFVAGQDMSVAGQFKTAPAATATPAQLRFAWLTCQDWSVNHWAAMDLIAAEDLDFLVHLGDYIYESVGAAFQNGAAEPAHGRITFPHGSAKPGGGSYATTLEDYRTLYRTYRSDPRLQELHRRFPMVAIWDDHEFSDDCWQDHQTYDNANEQQTARRRSATQAWAEYMPIDFGDVSFDLARPGYDNIRIYRDFRFGTLMHLVMTDQRLYRDDHLVAEAELATLLNHDPLQGDDKIGARYFVPLPILRQYEGLDTVVLKRTPSILGTTQTQWWKDTLRNSQASWKVWGNEVTLNRMWIDLRASAPPPYNQQYVVNADAWDGYPSHRAELMTYLKANSIANVVAITGDLHAFQCGVIRDNPDPAVGTPVAVDFVAAGISSDSFYRYLREGAGNTPLVPLVATPHTFDAVIRSNNPDFVYADHDAQGFAVATVSASNFVVTFNKVKPLNPDGTRPASPLLKRTRITLALGSTTPVVEDNV
ncbi:alkaline phosphatase D family protein [Massilia sp. PAMC28688]|uniref:alkaline phosphatase D family protein n=1 Tax=Massilia sp. PAMC28688 TaxID=2861283 RepID=UPI001C6318F8|nr:alkaline phosphatase D family protein [Massilia sp. PAMC28688]QYF93917.1 alkaline phosphatase D family protein [Massilia sp. PAMC28688]